MNTINTIDLADLIVTKIALAGDVSTHKKVQKLIYYVDVWHYVHFWKPLIEESFEAWVHWPILPSLYREWKWLWASNIETHKDDLIIQESIVVLQKRIGLSSDQVNLIDSVLWAYGSMNAMALEMQTHNEDPWIIARWKCGPLQNSTTPIDKEFCRKYYSSLIWKNDAE